MNSSEEESNNKEIDKQSCNSSSRSVDSGLYEDVFELNKDDSFSLTSKYIPVHLYCFCETKIVKRKAHLHGKGCLLSIHWLALSILSNLLPTKIGLLLRF